MKFSFKNVSEMSTSSDIWRLIKFTTNHKLSPKENFNEEYTTETSIVNPKGKKKTEKTDL